MNHTDPVCGMQVDEKSAAGQSSHTGHDYYFCSPECKTKFDISPDEYLKNAPRQ